MSTQATEGKEVWPVKMSSALSPGPALQLLLFLAQPRNWIIALHTTGRPAAQPLTQVITEDRETQTENYNNSLQVQHRDRKLIITKRLQFSNLRLQKERNYKIRNSSSLYQLSGFLPLRPECCWSLGATKGEHPLSLLLFCSEEEDDFDSLSLSLIKKLCGSTEKSQIVYSRNHS